ncbi:MAG TPA: CooT family nickel-binding protein [Thermodesulfovibrionales bacterium]|nr:CooT family nickel-binding protein [Thermodesulfovibrionales bacterium]
MCEIHAFVLKEGTEELFLENVNSAKSEGGKILLRSLFGEEKVFEGTIREVSLVKNRIILEKKG